MARAGPLLAVWDAAGTGARSVWVAASCAAAGAAWSTQNVFHQAGASDSAAAAPGEPRVPSSPPIPHASGPAPPLRVRWWAPLYEISSSGVYDAIAGSLSGLAVALGASPRLQDAATSAAGADGMLAADEAAGTPTGARGTAEEGAEAVEVEWGEWLPVLSGCGLGCQLTRALKRVAESDRWAPLALKASGGHLVARFTAGILRPDSVPQTREHARAGLVALLRRTETGEYVLSRGDRLPDLLKVLAEDEVSGGLGVALIDRIRDAGLRVHAATLPSEAELQQVVEMAGNPKVGALAREAAAWALWLWAGSSVAAAHAAAKAGAAEILVANASKAAPRNGTDRAAEKQASAPLGLQLRSAQALRAVLGSCPGLGTPQQRLEWLTALAASASASHRGGWDAVAAANVEAASSCLMTHPCFVGLARGSVEASVARNLDVALRGLPKRWLELAQSKDADLRAAVAGAFLVMSAITGGVFAEVGQGAVDAGRIGDALLPWALAGGNTRVQAAAGAALAGLSSLEGLFGQEMAHRWLAALLNRAADLSLAAVERAEQGTGPAVAGAPRSKLLRDMRVDEAQRAKEAAATLVRSCRVVPVPREPPPNEEQMQRPWDLAESPRAVTPAPRASIEEQATAALTLLGDLAGDQQSLQEELIEAGLPVLVQCLLARGMEAAAGADGGGAALLRNRQVSRLLATLCLHHPTHRLLLASPLLPWLRRASVEDDSFVSSSATRALLHLAYPVGAPANPQVAQPGAWEALARLRSWWNASPVGEALDDAIERMTDDHGAGLPPVYLDGTHLVNPKARHHRTLGAKGRGAPAPDGPAFDIVFVHGLMGDAFRTWRMRSYHPGWGFGAYAMPHDQVWPSAWLQADFPNARVLSYEYSAPMGYKWFTGQSAGFFPSVEELALAMTRKLQAAGVGERPVVFVTHSLGGIIVKQALVASAQSAALGTHGAAMMTTEPPLSKLAERARGVAFYSVPHFGAWTAGLGSWTAGPLRALGTGPSDAIEVLAPGQPLEALNAQFRRMTKRPEGLGVLSFLEGQRTNIPVGPGHLGFEVVPMESAYPGYGRYVVMESDDHVSIAKPPSRDAASYQALVRFIAEVAGTDPAPPNEVYALGAGA